MCKYCNVVQCYMFETRLTIFTAIAKILEHLKNLNFIMYYEIQYFDPHCYEEKAVKHYFNKYG